MTEAETFEENEICNGKFEVYNIHTNSIDKLQNFTILAQNQNNVQISSKTTSCLVYQGMNYVLVPFSSTLADFKNISSTLDFLLGY